MKSLRQVWAAAQRIRIQKVDCNQQPTFFIKGRPEAIPGVLVFYLLPLS